MIALRAQMNLSLSEAIALSLEHNFQIRLAALNVEQAELNDSWGAAGALPRITLSGRNQNNISDQSKNPTAFIKEKLYTTGLEAGALLNWTLFNGLGSYTNKQKLALLKDLSEGNEVLVVENSIQAVMLAYYNASLQQDLLGTLENLLRLSGDRTRYIESKYESGAATTFDVLQERSALLSDSTNYLLQQLNFDNAIRNLNMLMAQPIEQSYMLTTPLEIPEKNYALEAMREKMLSSNTNLQNQYINNVIAKRDIKIAQSQLYPAIGFQAGWTGSQSQFSAGDLSGEGSSLNYYGNFTLSFNLFDGGRVRRAIQSAHIREEMALVTTEEISLSLEKDLQTAASRYTAQLQICRISDANVKDASLNLQIAEEKYRNGVINSFNYRDIQLNYLNVSVSYLRSVFDLLGTQTELLRLTGGIISVSE